ncbi:peptidoglycan editing factor PgeF [uncultured Bacteroides sp.]|uniref:peptidoglycan editing factor PgeF n=1 Tax=uncultured Bacteroides sp. TaxID=162156 RepID=UPI002AA7F0E2|nr:peptidoglycan editing factor PgeF [uncultured Bacteroides sp.]
MILLTKDRAMLGYELLSAYPDIACFVTTRKGGCSTGEYGTFNCSPFTGDDAGNVRRNQDILCRSLPVRPHELIIPYQIHGTEVRIINTDFLAADAVHRSDLLNGVDAVVTQERGCCVCVSTADCIPILLYDRRNEVVAAVHAGWRGTVKGIVAHTLRVMKDTFGTVGAEVLACLGPGISLASFEVGEEVYESFRSEGYCMESISRWNEETSKYHIDLSEANRIQIQAFGVPREQIQIAGICTYIQHKEFFSARRLGIKSGRILSGIMLNK